MERVYFVEGPDGLQAPPKPIDGAFGCLTKGFSSEFLKHAGNHSPITREQFLMYYKGRKASIYADAVESLSQSPISRRDARLKTFVKAEKLNLDKKIDPAPRVIQPRSPRYNVELGVYLRPFEHKAFAAIAKVFGEPTVFKGYNLEEQARLMRDKWEKYQNPVAVGLDASRFDQHVSVEALEFEHSLYNQVFRHDRKLKRLLKWQIENEGIGFAHDGIIKYKKRGCRMSGDMNTSLGNCIIMCALIHQLSRELNVKLSLANNGDDCVVICERSDVVDITSQIPTFFGRFGFKMAIEPVVDVFEKIEFCQTQPVFDGEKYIMVRNPKTSMSKDVTCVLALRTAANFKEWMTSVSDCGLALTGGIPVLQSFYSCLNLGARKSGLTTKGHFVESGLAYHARNMNRVYANPTPEARVSFYLAFGIVPDLQESLESYYNSVKPDFDEPSPIDTYQVSGNELINGI